MNKKALLVGIADYKTAFPLKSAINDILDMESLLISEQGFAFEDVKVLADAVATRAAIERELRWLVQENAPGDMAIFYFTGHGFQVEDTDGTEVDELDEVLITYSEDKLEYISDDELFAIFSQMSPDLNFVAMLDCCHSGIDEEDFGRSHHTTLSEPPYVVLSAAQASQRSWQLGSDKSVSKHGYEWWEDNKYHSVFTFYFLKLMRMFKGKLTYREVVQKIRMYLEIHNYDQAPVVRGADHILDKQVFVPWIQPEPVASSLPS